MRILKAEFAKDADTFGKMDPFVEIKIGKTNT